MDSSPNRYSVHMCIRCFCALSPIKTVYRATGASLNPVSSRRLHKRKLLIPHVRGWVLSRSHRVIYSLPGGLRYIPQTRPCYFIRASCWTVHFHSHPETFKVHLHHNSQLILFHYHVFLIQNSVYEQFVGYIWIFAKILVACLHCAKLIWIHPGVGSSRITYLRSFPFCFVCQRNRERASDVVGLLNNVYLK